MVSGPAKRLAVGVVLVARVCVALAVGLAAAPPAVAGEKSRAARVHIDAGNAYFNLEKYKEAISEFEQAYLDKQDPAYFFNIAECHRLLGENAEAIRFYRRFLQETQNHPNQAQAEARMAELSRVGPTPAAAPPTVPPSPAASAPPVRSAAPPPPATSPSSAPPARAIAAPTPGASVPAPVIYAPTPAAVPASPNLTLANPPASPPESPGGAVASGPPVVVATPGPDSGAQHPLYKRWWFWALLGGLVSGGVVAGVLLSAPAYRPGCPSGVVCQ
jgi:hypothetical protein